MLSGYRRSSFAVHRGTASHEVEKTLNFFNFSDFFCLWRLVFLTIQQVSTVMTMQTRPIIILFGGSFDPIHNGHLAVAEYAFEHLDAARLIFIPARRSPHKSTGPSADGAARLAMIRLAIAGRAGFEVSDCELHRADPSYTLDTVRYFREQVGADAELFWLVGADTITELEHWYHVEELFGLCRLRIMYRGGMPRPDLGRLVPAFGPVRVGQLENDILATPLIDASSTEVRFRIAAGAPMDELVPPAVLGYIRQHGLYGAIPKSTIND
jgi:nicotinate-nucleotide adenylyltransferase